MKRIITFLSSCALAILIISCSSSRALITRGLNSEERRHYIIQNGFGVSKESKASFLAGFASVGMNQELVFNLYGAPDRTLEDDSIWEYVDSHGQLITGFKFEDKMVVEVMGDPRAGLPMEEAAP